MFVFTKQDDKNTKQHYFIVLIFSSISLISFLNDSSLETLAVCSSFNTCHFVLICSISLSFLFKLRNYIVICNNSIHTFFWRESTVSLGCSTEAKIASKRFGPWRTSGGGLTGFTVFGFVFLGFSGFLQ